MNPNHPAAINLMLASIQYLGWLHSLWKKIFITGYKDALIAVSAFVVGNISLFLAFVLPLKILLLAGREKMPTFLSDFVSPEDKVLFLILLSFSSVASFAAYLICEKILNTSVFNGANNLISNTNKFTLFQNQQELAQSFFRRLCSSGGALILSLIFLTIGFFINHFLFFSIISLLIFEITIIITFGLIRPILVKHLLLPKEFSKTLKRLSAINFLVGFILLLYQLLTGSEIYLLTTMVCLLLLRQIMQKLEIFFMDSRSLWLNHNKIEALFFTHKTHEIDAHTSIQYISTTFAHEHRNEWIRDSLEKILNKHFLTVESYYSESAHKGNLNFHVHGFCDDNTDNRQFFVKTYDNSSSHHAIREKEFFKSLEKPSCAPSYLGGLTAVEKTVLVFEGLSKDHPSKEMLEEAGLNHHYCVMAIKINNNLLKKALRTTPIFLRTFNTEFMRPLFIATNTIEDREILIAFLEAFTLLQRA